MLLAAKTLQLVEAFAGQLHSWFGTRTSALGGGLTVVLSMALFAVGAGQQSMPLVVAGLVLAGLGLGVATPGLSVAAANASDAEDLGVSAGMRSTLNQVGVTAGIQSMTIALGSSYTPSAFAGSFWLGCGVAGAATALALFVRD